jgi:hypothetical protein
MIKFFLAGTVLLCGALFTTAQPKPLFEYEFNSKQKASNIHTFFAENPQSHTITFSICDETSIKRYQIDSSGIIQQHLYQYYDSSVAVPASFTNKKQIPEQIHSFYNQIFICASLDRNYLTEVFSDQETNTYNFIKTDFTSGETVVDTTIQFTDGEKLMNSFIKNNDIWLVSYREKADSLFLYRKPQNLPVEQKRLYINVGDSVKPFSTFSPNIRSSFRYFLKETMMMDEDQYYSPPLTSSQKKIVFSESAISFIASSLDFHTIAVTVKIPECTYTVIKYDQHPQLKNPYEPALISKAATITNRVITIHKADDDKLRINFFDKATSQLLASHILTSKEVNEIGTQPVTQTGTFNSNDEIKVKTIKTMLNQVPNIGITPVIANDKMYVTIGGVFNRTSIEEVGLSLFGSLLGTTIMNSLVTSYSWMVVTTFNIADSRNTIIFQMAFDTTTFQPVKAEFVESPLQPLNDFLKENKKEFASKQVIRINGKFYLAGLSNDKKHYRIYSFGK